MESDEYRMWASSERSVKGENWQASREVCVTNREW
jgi:hypothetical protein